jgi:hypothetical protein
MTAVGQANRFIERVKVTESRRSPPHHSHTISNVIGLLDLPSPSSDRIAPEDRDSGTCKLELQ